MLKIKTVNELKRKLPEVLKYIDVCKRTCSTCIMLLHAIKDCCVIECLHEDVDFGTITAPENYTSVYKTYMETCAEKEYLEGLVRKLPEYKDKII